MDFSNEIQGYSDLLQEFPRGRDPTAPEEPPGNAFSRHPRRLPVARKLFADMLDDMPAKLKSISSIKKRASGRLGLKAGPYPVTGAQMKAAWPNKVSSFPRPKVIPQPIAQLLDLPLPPAPLDSPQFLVPDVQQQASDESCLQMKGSPICPTVNPPNTSKLQQLTTEKWQEPSASHLPLFPCISEPLGPSIESSFPIHHSSSDNASRIPSPLEHNRFITLKAPQSRFVQGSRTVCTQQQIAITEKEKDEADAYDEELLTATFQSIQIQHPGAVGHNYCAAGVPAKSLKSLSMGLHETKRADRALHFLHQQPASNAQRAPAAPSHSITPCPTLLPSQLPPIKANPIHLASATLSSTRGLAKPDCGPRVGAKLPNAKRQLPSLGTKLLAVGTLVPADPIPKPQVSGLPKPIGAQRLSPLHPVSARVSHANVRQRNKSPSVHVLQRRQPSLPALKRPSIPADTLAEDTSSIVPCSDKYAVVNQFPLSAPAPPFSADEVVAASCDAQEIVDSPAHYLPRRHLDDNGLSSSLGSASASPHEGYPMVDSEDTSHPGAAAQVSIPHCSPEVDNSLKAVSGSDGDAAVSPSGVSRRLPLSADSQCNSCSTMSWSQALTLHNIPVRTTTFYNCCPVQSEPPEASKGEPSVDEETMVAAGDGITD